MFSLNFALDKIEEYDWMTLGEDEEIEWRSHPSPIPHLKDIVVGIAISIVSVFIAINYGAFLTEQHELLVFLPVFTFFGGIGIALYEYAMVKSTFFVITNKKFVRKDNIIAISTQKIPTKKIQNKDYEQKLWQKAFNIGDLTIYTAGTGTAETVLRNVPDPKTPYEYLEDGSQDEDNEVP